MGIELMTSSLPRMRSTPELHRLIIWSGKRGSNSRPSAWKADALPTELLPQKSAIFAGFPAAPRKCKQVWHFARLARELRLFSQTCGESRIRTYEGIASRFTVCPSWPLWYLPKRLILAPKSVEPIEGFEPTTPRLQITCSGQLSYIGGM